MRGTRQKRQGERATIVPGIPEPRLCLSLCRLAARACQGLKGQGVDAAHMTESELFPRVTHTHTKKEIGTLSSSKRDLFPLLPLSSSLPCGRGIHPLHQTSRQAKHEQGTSTFSPGCLAATGKTGSQNDCNLIDRSEERDHDRQSTRSQYLGSGISSELPRITCENLAPSGSKVSTTTSWITRMFNSNLYDRGSILVICSAMRFHNRTVHL